MRFLVYAWRDWSWMNAEPLSCEHELDRWWREKGEMPSLEQYDAILICEPHIDGWRQTYPEVVGKLPLVALQQTLFWCDVVRPNSSWLFDYYFVWGEQMREMAIKHDCSADKIFVTGNPRFDKFYNMPIEDKGFTLILGGGGGDKIHTYPIINTPYVYLPHPIYNDWKVRPDSEELMRTASNVMFRTTGGGIIPMIMNKPVMIMSLLSINDTARMNGYTRFMKSKLYGKNVFGTDPEFVFWATTGPGSTERVLDTLGYVL